MIAVLMSTAVFIIGGLICLIHGFKQLISVYKTGADAEIGVVIGSFCIVMTPALFWCAYYMYTFHPNVCY